MFRHPDPAVDHALLRSARLYPGSLVAHVVVAVTGISPGQGRHRIDALAAKGFLSWIGNL